MTDGVTHSRVFVLFLTDGVLGRPWVQHEARAGTARTRPQNPVRPHQTRRGEQRAE